MDIELCTGTCQWLVAGPLRPHGTASGLTHTSPGHIETGQRALVTSSTNHKECQTEKGGGGDITKEGRE